MIKTTAADIPCLCGHREYTLIARTRFDSHGVGGYPFSLLSCADCGLVRISPLPSQDFVSGTDDTAALLSDLGIARANARKRVMLIKQFLPSGRLVDFGANIGLTVEEAGRAGYEAVGLDLDQAACRIARDHGRNVHCRRLQESGFPDGSFDAILISHVLEHIVDPGPDLREIHRILKPGGWLFVYVPNYSGWLSKALGRHWAGLCPTKHIWMFTPGTLAAVLTRGGLFTIVRWFTSCAEPLGAKRPLINTVKTWLAYIPVMFGRGDELVMVLRKP